MLSRTSLTAARTLSQRRMSTAAPPKMHKAKGLWDALKSKRPIDADEEHKLFHPPFGKGPVLAVVLGSTAFGVGTMVIGVSYQQIKQGFWK